MSVRRRDLTPVIIEIRGRKFENERCGREKEDVNDVRICSDK